MPIEMQSLTAASVDQLLASLEQIDISVPLRTEGRTTGHCEASSICRFLSTYSDTELLTYPLELTHRDRPDFLIKHSAGEVGIEVTEVVPENRAAVDAYRERKGIEGSFFLQGHAPDEPKLRGSSSEQLLGAAIETQP